jgi:acetoin utilization protein AcuB
MRLREIMRTRVETISPSESASVALERMRRSRFRHLVVCDERGPVGVISDRDVGGVGSLRRVETVEDVMSQPIVTGSPDMTVREAANLLRGRTIGCLPVLEQGKVVGIITGTDLLELIGADLERPEPKTRMRVRKERGPRHRPVSGRGRTVRLPAPR